MINHKFKAGDLVYCPAIGRCVYQLQWSDEIDKSLRPIKIESGGESKYFNPTGYQFVADDMYPSLFPATKEMREAFMTIFPQFYLEKLEDYYKRVGGLELEAMYEKIQAKLDKDGFAWCGVSDVDLETAKKHSNDTIVKIVKVEKKPTGKLRFFRRDMTPWSYAYLIENQ